MIYLDELLPTHQKILQAGRLIGDAAGGRCAALGLYVSAIAYARLHLTNGIVPDDFLLSCVRPSASSRNAIEALRRAGLIKKLRGSRWAIHDFLQWNKSADQILKERGLTKTRQQKWRSKKQGESGSRNAVTAASHDRLGDVPVTPLSRVPTIPNPQVPIPNPCTGNEVRTSQVRASSSFVATSNREQRPDGRDSSVCEMSKEEKTALSREQAADRNYAVLVKLAHTVMDAEGDGDPTNPDIVEAVKCAAAARGIAYPPDVLANALRSAGAQRLLGTRPVDGPMAGMANAVRLAIANNRLPETARAMARGRRR